MTVRNRENNIMKTTLGNMRKAQDDNSSAAFINCLALPFKMGQGNDKNNWEKQGKELEMKLNFLIHNTRAITVDREEIKRKTQQHKIEFSSRNLGETRKAA